MRAMHIRGLMPFVNLCAEFFQPRSYRRRLQIRSRRRVAARQQHLRDPAHSAPANSDEMDALEIAERYHHGRDTSSSRSTISSTARGFANARARSSISEIFRG